MHTAVWEAIDAGSWVMRREPPEDGLMCELLWSDPQAENGRSPSKRGVGVAFGAPPELSSGFDFVAQPKMLSPTSFLETKYQYAGQ